MNLRLFAAAAALAVVSASTSAHAATITTYTLTNVELTNGVGGPADGTLNGTFTFNSTTDTLTAADITASAGVPPASHTGGGYEFTFGVSGADSTYTGAGFPTYFTLTSASNASDVLFLSFSSALNGSGPDSILSGTYENEATLGVRNVGTGYFATVGSAVAPEPSSIVLLGSGLLTAAGMLRRRRAPLAV